MHVSIALQLQLLEELVSASCCGSRSTAEDLSSHSVDLWSNTVQVGRLTVTSTARSAMIQYCSSGGVTLPSTLLLM